MAVPAKFHRVPSLLVAAVVLVIVSTLVDVLIANPPMRFNIVAWRFQFATQFAHAAPQFALELVVLLFIGIYGEMRAVARAAGIIAIVLGISYVLLVPMYALDTLQVHSLVAQAVKTSFIYHTLKDGAFAGILGILFIWFGAHTVTASKAVRDISRTEGRDLVVGQY